MVILPYLLDDRGHPKRRSGDRAYVRLSSFHSLAPAAPAIDEVARGAVGLSPMSSPSQLGRDRLSIPHWARYSSWD